MLKHKDGYVLKPVNRPVQGEKEIKFYEEMQKVVDPLLLEFRSFIPEYYGTTVLDLNGKSMVQWWYFISFVVTVVTCQFFLSVTVIYIFLL